MKTSIAKRSSSEAAITRRNEYVTKYYSCVEKVARRVARRLPTYIDIDELISAGSIGLIEAAERYDPARCDRFEAFAELRIRGAILDELRARDTLSRDMRRLANELRAATAKVASQLGRTPDEGEVAGHIGISIDEIHARRLKLSGSCVIGLEDADPEFFEHTAAEKDDNPQEIAARRELFARMVEQIEVLPKPMQQVLSLYYCEGLNLKQIGSVMGVTESRVCQIHGEATRRLRVALGQGFFEEAVA
jgi:RNA polymerase sigma factor for flagellar operon FliA